MDKRQRIISENIRIERMKRHYTQEEFSEEIGISPNFLYRIEAGTSTMSLQTLLRIQEVLGVDGNAILGKAEVELDRPSYMDELLNLLSDCEDKEIALILETIKHLKASLRKIYV